MPEFITKLRDRAERTYVVGRHRVGEAMRMAKLPAVGECPICKEELPYPCYERVCERTKEYDKQKLEHAIHWFSWGVVTTLSLVIIIVELTVLFA